MLPQAHRTSCRGGRCPCARRLRPVLRARPTKELAGRGPSRSPPSSTAARARRMAAPTRQDGPSGSCRLLGALVGTVLNAPGCTVLGHAAVTRFVPALRGFMHVHRISRGLEVLDRPSAATPSDRATSNQHAEPTANAAAFVYLAPGPPPSHRWHSLHVCAISP